MEGNESEDEPLEARIIREDFASALDAILLCKENEVLSEECITNVIYQSLSPLMDTRHGIDTIFDFFAAVTVLLMKGSFTDPLLREEYQSSMMTMIGNYCVQFHGPLMPPIHQTEEEV
ncbi:hypothetical protein [Candidatus Poriferisodalis sp.]|uniref:hypothetical protein n=1 Tax=Candidatus Poriferisodalis sp. TaxID=3101277 RepID=UPI003B02CFF1